MTAPGEPLHLLKLCVGADSVEDLRQWQTQRAAERQAAGLDPRPRHRTRQWPRRDTELLAGGSLYWVIRGVVAARQQIEALDEVTGEDGLRRCEIVMSPEIVPVAARPRRPFQGWRYLPGPDAPPDIGAAGAQAADIPGELAANLDRFGVVRV